MLLTTKYTSYKVRPNLKSYIEVSELKGSKLIYVIIFSIAMLWIQQNFRPTTDKMLNGLNKSYSLGAIEEFKLKAVKSTYVSITKTFTT